MSTTTLTTWNTSYCYHAVVGEYLMAVASQVRPVALREMSPKISGWL